MKLRTPLIAPTIAFVLSVNLFAEDSYTIQTKTLKEALEIISEKSKLSYIANESLLRDKKAPNIHNVDGLQNALELVLKDSGLEAIIKNNTIVIKKKKGKKTSSPNSLGEIEVLELLNNITEDSGSYTVAFTNSATRMNLSLKDTPQSISVITRDKMDDLGLESIEDLVTATTGLYADYLDTERKYFYSRGFEIENFQIDGIPTNITSNGYTTLQDLGMYDRVDVIRGATGLLSGSGEPSATLNYVRKKAKSKEFTGNVSIDLGSWKKKKATIDLSSGLNEDGSIRGRIYASKTNKESFIDLYEKDEKVIFGTIETDISDNTLFTVGASYQARDAQAVTWGALPPFYDDGTSTSFDRSTTIASPWTHRESEQKRFFTSLEHIFQNRSKLYMTYSYGITEEANDLSYIYGAPNKETGLGLEEWASGKEDDLTKEHSLDFYSSIPYDFFNQNHELIVGLSYSKRDASIVGINYAESRAEPGSFYKWKGTKKPTIDSKNSKKSFTIEEKALYFANKFSINDDLKMILGARLTSYDNSGEELYGDVEYSNKHKNEITPYFGLVYDINEEHSIYTSYTEIFRAQDERNQNNDFLAPKVGNSYEVGIKGSYFENRLNASANIFKTIQDNVAVEDGIIIGTVDDTAYREAKGVTTKGFEIEISGEVTDKLNLSLGISKFEAKEENGTKVNTDTPREKVNLNAKYKFDRLALGAGINWQSKIYADYSDDGFGTRTQKSFATANLMMEYDFTKDLSLQININNLFDKTYYSSIGGFGLNYGAPRNFNFKLNYKF